MVNVVYITTVLYNTNRKFYLCTHIVTFIAINYMFKIFTPDFEWIKHIVGIIIGIG